MSKYLLAFLSVVLITFGIYSFTTDINTAAETKNSQYASYLAAATHDAAKEIQSETTGNVSMPTVSDRERVANTFYNSLKLDFGYTTEEDMQKLHIYVPVLAMIDSDGYYICFNQQYADETGHMAVTESITPINTWTKQSGNYIARYYLGNNLDVTETGDTSQMYSGAYDFVYEQLKDSADADALASLGLTGKEEDFQEAKRSVIIEDIQQKIEYYINQNNDFAAEYTPSYTFTMPQTDNDDWTRLIENPTCIAFLQGIRVTNGRDYLNIYSIGGGEVKKQTVVGFTDSDTSKTYNTAGVDKDSDGYVPTSKAAAKDASDGDTIINKEPTTVEDLVPHKHWGNPSVTRSSDEIGCYTKPVYHVHTTECYTRFNHRHFDQDGNELNESVEWVGTDGKYYDKNNREIPKSLAVRSGVDAHADYKRKVNCFKGEVHHTHTDACYKIKYHKHTNSCYRETVISYKNGQPVTAKVLTCGYYAYDPDTDTLLDLTDEEQKALDDGALTRQYFIERAIEGKELVCGKTEGDLVGYRKSCNKKDGAFESQELACGRHALTDDEISGDESKMTVNDIDHYEIGCGYKDGQMVPKSVAETINQPEAGE